MRKLTFINSLVTTLFSIVVFFSFSCKKDSCSENKNPDCACLAVYEPVCGCNEKTYGNSCEAECAGINEYTEGVCN